MTHIVAGVKVWDGAAWVPSVGSAHDILAEATWYIDAQSSAYDGGQTVPNLGTGGSSLAATLGSTGGSDTNDPTFLAYAGTPYVYLPGVVGNYLSADDDAAYHTTDLALAFRVASDDWTAGAPQSLGTRRDGGGYSWQLQITGTGYLELVWTADGSTLNTATSTAALSLTDGTAYWIRVRMDVNDGGVYKVYFDTAADAATVPSSWTALGSTVTGGAATSIFAGTAPMWLGYRFIGDAFLGRFHRAVMWSDLTLATIVLDVDTSVITDGSATTFTEQSSNAATVTINRSTSGRKSVAVVAPVFLLGTDDYIETPDNALLDFGASDSFTVLAVVRRFGEPSGVQEVLTKGFYGGSPAFTLTYNGATGFQAFYAGAASDPLYYSNAATSAGSHVFALVRDGSTPYAYKDAAALGTGFSSGTLSGSISNASPLRVGVNAIPSGYADMEFTAAAIWRRALTAAEITALSGYFANR